MLAHLYLATGLLACLALASPAPVEADHRHHGSVIIGVPSVEIHSPPVSIYFGPQPIYRPYYYYPPRYYPAPRYYYGPRYYPRHYHHRPYGRPYHRDYYRNYHRR